VIAIRIYLLFGIILAIITCGKIETTGRFAEYLQEEKKLRERVLNPQELADSLTALKNTIGIDPDQEILKLQAEPADWITLLRKLKSAR
jgi:hypothetical protein